MRALSQYPELHKHTEQGYRAAKYCHACFLFCTTKRRNTPRQAIFNWQLGEQKESTTRGLMGTDQLSRKHGPCPKRCHGRPGCEKGHTLIAVVLEGFTQSSRIRPRSSGEPSATERGPCFGLGSHDRSAMTTDVARAEQTSATGDLRACAA